MNVRDLGTRPASATIREIISRVVRRAARSPTVVQRQQIPYWQERGWTRNGRIYTGSYQTPHGAFCGHIEQIGTASFEFFLYQPSAEIRRHSHWVCFQDRKNDWYLVHMGREPKDVSSGILTIERLITESYEGS
jgi:hypothetical protein